MATVITHNDLHRLTEKLRRARSLDEVDQQCTEFCTLTGFDFYSYCVTIPTILTRPDMIEISSYPKKWQTLYHSKGLVKIDPTLIYAETHHTPTTWSEIVHSCHNEKNACKYIRNAKKHGLKSGITFPLRGNVGNIAVLNLASKKTSPLPQTLIDTALVFGTLFANHVHDAVLRIFDEDLLPIKKKRLSHRERECLLWVAEGKTTWEIAKILKIANRTVSYHLENIISKLEVKNRQQAVAHGLMMSYISHRLDWEPPHQSKALVRTAS